MALVLSIEILEEMCCTTNAKVLYLRALLSSLYADSRMERYIFLEHNHSVENAKPKRVLILAAEKLWKSHILTQIRQGKTNNDIVGNLRRHGAPFTLPRSQLNKWRYRHVKHAWKMNKDDRVSLRMRVNEDRWGLQEEEIIIFKDSCSYHNVHRNLNYNEFILAVMTAEQVQYWRQYAHRRICIDSTHGISRHKLKLVTLLVLGPHEVGIPVAILFTTKENNKVLKAFFHEIKVRIGNDLEYKYIMSDDYPAYFDSFSKIFGPARRLLCSFHVKQAWKRKLKKLVDSNVNAPQGIRSSLVSKLLTLTSNISNSAFGYDEEQKTRELEELLVRHGLEEYLQYLQTYYMQRKTQWMTRYRRDSHVSTNNYCEGYHSALKTDLRSQGILSGRVDRVVHIIMEKVRSRVTECGSKKDDSHRFALLKRRHNDSMRRIRRRDVELESPQRWIVTDWSNYKSFRVKKLRQSICCDMLCEHCNACKHQFKCDCTLMPYGPNGFCIHIHAVCMSCMPLAEVGERRESDVVNVGGMVIQPSVEGLSRLSQFSMEPGVGGESSTEKLAVSLCLENLASTNVNDMFEDVDESKKAAIRDHLKAITELLNGSSASR